MSWTDKAPPGMTPAKVLGTLSNRREGPLQSPDCYALWVDLGTPTATKCFGSGSLESREAARMFEWDLIVSLRNLSTYRKKRDFEKTAEPSGDTPVVPSKRRRFVIQAHDATRLHYDLRLGVARLFKSCAGHRRPSPHPPGKPPPARVCESPLA